MALGASNLGDALSLEYLPHGCPPAIRGLFHVLRAANSLTYGPELCVTRKTPSPDTEACAKHIATLSDRYNNRLVEVRNAEKALERALALRQDIGIARHYLRKSRAEAQKVQREIRKLDSPRCHAARIGSAWVDLRLARKVLRAIGGKSITLSAAGALDPLLAEGGGSCGLVMPFRH